MLWREKTANKRPANESEIEFCKEIAKSLKKGRFEYNGDLSLEAAENSVFDV
jgi:hypothetical protein